MLMLNEKHQKEAHGPEEMLLKSQSWKSMCVYRENVKGTPNLVASLKCSVFGFQFHSHSHDFLNILFAFVCSDTSTVNSDVGLGTYLYAYLFLEEETEKTAMPLQSENVFSSRARIRDPISFESKIRYKTINFPSIS